MARARARVRDGRPRLGMRAARAGSPARDASVSLGRGRRGRVPDLSLDHRRTDRCRHARDGRGADPPGPSRARGVGGGRTGRPFRRGAGRGGPARPRAGRGCRPEGRRARGRGAHRCRLPGRGRVRAPRGTGARGGSDQRPGGARRTGPGARADPGRGARRLGPRDRPCPRLPGTRAPRFRPDAARARPAALAR